MIVPCDTVLVFYGLAPKLGPIAEWGLDINRKTINVDTERFETSTPGIYAVGDINFYPGKKKLILSGFHEAALAAFAAKERIEPEKKVRLQYTTTSPLMHERLGISRRRVNPSSSAKTRGCRHDHKCRTWPCRCSGPTSLIGHVRRLGIRQICDHQAGLDVVAETVGNSEIQVVLGFDIRNRKIRIRIPPVSGPKWGCVHYRSCRSSARSKERSGHRKHSSGSSLPGQSGKSLPPPCRNTASRNNRRNRSTC